MVASRFVALLPALTAAAGQVAQDIKIDLDKLTDFSADVSVKLQKVGWRDLLVKDVQVTGHLQFDLANKTLKFTTKNTFDIEKGYHRYQDEHPTSYAGQGVSELYFDPSNGVLIKESATLFSSAQLVGGSEEVGYCIKSDVPIARKLPPGAMLQQMLEAQEPMVEQGLNAYPHTVADGIVTYRKNQSYYYSQSESQLEIDSDGTPVSLSYDRFDKEWKESNRGNDSDPYSNDSEWTEEWVRNDHIAMNFTNWEKGAGEMEEPHCVEASPRSAMPSMSLIVLEALSVQLVQSLPTQDVGEYLFRLAVILQEKHVQVPSEPAWHSAVLPFAAGMSGAAVLLAFVKVFAGKRVRSEPLLSAA